MAQPVGPLFGTRWPNREPVPVPARTFLALALLGAKKFQVRTQDGFSTIVRGAGGPAQRKKKRRGYRFSTVVLITQLASSRRTKQAICWSWTAASGGVMDAQHLGDLEGLQSAFASTKMGLQRPAADLVVSRSTGSDARCRLVVQIAAGKQVALVGCAAGTKSQVRARATGPIRPHSLVVSSYFAGSLVERANAALSAHPAPLRTSCVSPLGHIMS